MVSFMVKADTGWRYDVAAIACDYLSGFYQSGALFWARRAGLGCAPIYPSVIHSTPAHFGADKSQAVIGVQMASAYVGTCLVRIIRR